MATPDRVYVLLIKHKHGTDLTVFRRDDAAYKALEEYCRTWWDHEFSDDTEMPENGDQLVRDYFAHVEDEDWSVDMCEVL